MKKIQLVSLLYILCFTQLAFSAGVTFEWNPRSQSASTQTGSNRVPTASSGTLITVDGKGFAGDSISLADIVFFEFTHEWEDSVSGETGTSFFDLNDLISRPLFPLVVSADGIGFDSGSIQADNGTNFLRMLANAATPIGDVNDNYLVDEFAQTNTFSNGWNGGGFGAWVNINPTVVPLPTSIWFLLSGIAMLSIMKRKRQ